MRARINKVKGPCHKLLSNDWQLHQLDRQSLLGSWMVNQLHGINENCEEDLIALFTIYIVISVGDFSS